jgi:hypothetical protein
MSRVAHLPGPEGAAAADVAERLQGVIATISSGTDHVLALVFPADLCTMQAKRVASPAQLRFFTSIEEADVWLTQQRAAGHVTSWFCVKLDRARLLQST